MSLKRKNSHKENVKSMGLHLKHSENIYRTPIIGKEWCWKIRAHKHELVRTASSRVSYQKYPNNYNVRHTISAIQVEKVLGVFRIGR